MSMTKNQKYFDKIINEGRHDLEYQLAELEYRMDDLNPKKVIKLVHPLKSKK